MTLKINSTFQGASVFSLDPGQKTWKAIAEDAAGDLMLIRYILTGDGSGPSSNLLVNHSGYDGTRHKGALLRYPICQTIEAPRTHPDVCGSDANIDTWCRVVPFYMPPGQDQLVIQQVVEDIDNELENATFLFELYDTASNQPGSGSPVTSGAPSILDDEPLSGTQAPRSTKQRKQLYKRFFNLTDDKLYFFVIRADMAIDAAQAWRWGPLRIYDPIASAGQPGGISSRLDDPTSSLPANPVDTTTSSAGAELPDFVELQSEAFSNDYGLSGYHSYSITATQNAMAEYLTGAPAWGNESYSLVDSTATAPTDSAFHDGSQAQAEDIANTVGFDKNAEPLWTIPILAQPYGMQKSYSPGSAPSTVSWTGQFTTTVAPYINNTAAKSSYTPAPITHIAYIPHTPNSNLKVSVLIGSTVNPTGLLTLNGAALDSGGSSVGTGTGSFTYNAASGSGGSSGYYGWATATVSAADWDAVNILETSVTISSWTTGEWWLLGLCWYITP